MKVAIIERKLFGGTCVNTGCMPTKTLVASAYAAHLARRGAEYGFAFERPLGIDMGRVKARADPFRRIPRTNVEKWLRGMDGLTVFEGHARFEGPDRLRVGESLLTAPRIFINVGGRARSPTCRASACVDYLTNTSILELDAVPRAPVVVGGSYVGLEFAQMYRRFGAEVTIVEMGPRLIAREDEDVSEAVREILVDEGIVVRTDASCISFGRMRTVSACRHRLHRGAPEVGSHVLLAVGRRPNTDDLGLDKRRRLSGRARLHRRRRLARDQCARHLGPGRLQRPWRLHPYLLQRFRDRRRQSARWRDRRVSDRIPGYALYIDPPLGRVGLTETEARRTGRKLLVAKRPMTRVGRAIEKGETQGFMKVVADAETSKSSARPSWRGRRRGDPRHPRHRQRRSALYDVATGGADSPDRLGADPHAAR